MAALLSLKIGMVDSELTPSSIKRAQSHGLLRAVRERDVLGLHGGEGDRELLLGTP
ncbi:hypothetical protein Mapa_010092 [Marchantia paleacea]|nr:hypothetical protein Mapa_010092 [Marchantia paleacea]